MGLPLLLLAAVLLVAPVVVHAHARRPRPPGRLTALPSPLTALAEDVPAARAALARAEDVAAFRTRLHVHLATYGAAEFALGRAYFGFPPDGNGDLSPDARAAFEDALVARETALRALGILLGVPPSA